MRIGWMVLAGLMVGRFAAAEDVTVCFTARGSALTSAATDIATLTFQRAGVAIEWKQASLRPSGMASTWLRVELVDTTPPGRRLGELAVSYPYAPCSKGITVFYDRLRSLARGPSQESALLAYVLVHEITHVIQGVARHSNTGIMKDQWNEQDRTAIFQRRLAFETWDVLLLRQSLAHGRCGEAPSLTTRSSPGIGFRPE
jgi:hypothetical protein